MSKHAEPLPPPRPDDSSYYGRPILKPPAWDWRIPAYLLAGGASAGSTLLSVGADLSGRPRLRRRTRIAAGAALGASMYFLVSDLGKPLRPEAGRSPITVNRSPPHQILTRTESGRYILSPGRTPYAS